MSYGNPLSSSDQPRRIQNLGGGRPPDRRPVKQAGVYGASPPPTPPPPEDEDADKLKRSIAIHNEQVKLASTAINNSSINLITAGIIVPFVAMGFEFTTAPPATQITLITIGAWGVVAYILRSWAHSNLERMR